MQNTIHDLSVWKLSAAELVRFTLKISKIVERLILQIDYKTI